MQIQDLGAVLRANTYPGRGIVLGKSADGTKTVIAYFIMGRSENSRNRIFVEEEGGLRTEAFDPAKLKDPSLVIYWPVRKLGRTTIVTNGDQTDTIYEFLAAEKTFEEALRMRTFEPDPPILTPRISGLVHKDGSYRLSILKSANGNADSVQRFFYEYPQPVAGEGHFIHTYLGDGDPVPSFEGEPENVMIEGDIDSFTKLVWDHLNEANKVSLFVRFIDLADGSEETRVVNKNS
ncbi:MAG: IMP cyclohydrolase [Candidatus Fimivicinus sp.]|nr:IMP cyclohydrolase [Oscillospiraceae bacterium]MDY5591490.1 IMP cyclohydrolase [Candidatus Fimivicinus sp.]